MSDKSESHRAKPRASRSLLSVMVIGSALTLFDAPCLAQCVEFSDRTAQVDLDTFVKAPSSMLEGVRTGKGKLKYLLSAYIASDPSILPSVQTLIANATSSDRTAIGAALRLAEARCTASKPDAARKIKDFAQKLGDRSVLAGYAVAGEDQLAPQIETRDKNSKPRHGADSLSGDLTIRLADPFEPIPLPE